MADPTSPGARPGDGPEAAPADARRLRRRRWSDPRIAVGGLLVAGSVVGGAAYVDAQDDTVAVWALRSDARGGEHPVAADLRPVDVHLDGDVARRYLRVDDPLAIEQRLSTSSWTRDLGAGELVCHACLARREASAVGELPLAVAPGAVPADLAVGQRVDVWVSPDGAKAGATADADATARRVLEQVRVVDAGSSSVRMSQSATQTVLVALDEESAALLDDVLAELGRGRVVLVRRPGAEGLR